MANTLELLNAKISLHIEKFQYQLYKEKNLKLTEIWKKAFELGYKCRFVDELEDRKER